MKLLVYHIGEPMTTNGARIALFLARPLAAQHTISTIAGGIVRPGSAADSVLVMLVDGMVWDSAGNLIFCDPLQNLIRRVKPDGTTDILGPVGIAGPQGPTLSTLDAAGNVYFYDASNSIIRRLGIDGTVVTVAGNGVPFATGMDREGPALARSLRSIQAIRADRSGNLYFTEADYPQYPYGASLRRVGVDGSIKLLTFLTSRGLAVAGDRVLNFGDGAIDSIGPDGSISHYFGYGRTPARDADGTTLASDVFFPGILEFAAAPDGSVYVDYVDRGPKVPDQGTVRITPDGYAKRIGGFAYGGGLAPDGLGRLAYPWMGLPQLLNTAKGTFTPLAGGNPESVADGTAGAQSWLLQPAGITVGRDGTVYFYENRGCRIRTLGVDGVIGTFAGTGQCSGGFAGPQTADLPAIRALAVDSAGRVFVTDSLGRICRIEANGTRTILGLTASLFGGYTLAVDGQDRLVVNQQSSRFTGEQSLARVEKDGRITSLFVAAGGRIFALGTDSARNIYFSGDDVRSYFIKRVNDDGSIASLYENLYAWAFTIDMQGNVWLDNGHIFGSYGGASYLDSNVVPVVAPNGDIIAIRGNSIIRISGAAPAAKPIISPGGVVNSLSYTGGGIAPGELVSIFGASFGTATLQAAVVNNRLPFSLGGVRVRIDGRDAPILAVSPNQVNAIVPHSVRPTGVPVDVRVQFDTAVSDSAPTAAATSAVAIATANQSGTGQGAIVNQDGTVNSPLNPAARGSIVSFYGTGEGLFSLYNADGYLTLSTSYPQAAGVTVAIGGQMAELLYAGAAPFQVAGVLQINARIPVVGAVGNLPVSVTAGASMTTRVVTVAVR